MKPNDFFRFVSNTELAIVPNSAILFHETKGLAENSYGGQTFVASIHDFFPDGQGNNPVIGAGRLLSKEDIEALLKSLLQRRQNKIQLLPSNVVSVSDNHIAWTIPASIRPMLFNIAGMPMKKLSVPWPNLLMVANRNGKMAVAAFKGNRRPTAKTTLYNAPLMNFSHNGAVCTGSATVPVECGIEDLSHWESLMFDTAFSHVNNQRTVDLGKEKKDVDTKAHFKFWQAVAKQQPNAFPNQHLVPLSRGIAQFIQEHCA